MSRRVAFVFQDGLEKYSYGEDHPMQPIRSTMTFDLLRNQ